MHPLLPILLLTTFTLPATPHLIPNEYIIIYKTSVTVSTTTTHESWLQAHATNVNKSRMNAVFQGLPELPAFKGFRFLQRFNLTGVRGYAAVMTDGMAERISGLSEVAFVEQNQVVKGLGVQEGEGVGWGLRRLSKKELPLGSLYRYPEVAGAGSIVYVLDTGIRITHSEFNGRALYGKTFVTGETEVDYNGHGTHISGIIAGRTYGVSKKSTIISVKVLNARGLGSTSGIVSALQWVKRHALASNRPCVVNVSVGGGASMAVDNAVNDVSGGAGCFVVAAAGNEGSDACQGSPGRARFAYTVGATDERDGMAGFSNYGSCVDILAAGVKITSSWAASNTAITTLSGTSMACPFVSGVAALAYSHFAFKSPGEAMTYINSLAATGQITGLTGERAMTPNRLLQLPAEFPASVRITSTLMPSPWISTMVSTVVSPARLTGMPLAGTSLRAPSTLPVTITRSLSPSPTVPLSSLSPSPTLPLLSLPVNRSSPSPILPLPENTSSPSPASTLTSVPQPVPPPLATCKCQ